MTRREFLLSGVALALGPRVFDIDPFQSIGTLKLFKEWARLPIGEVVAKLGFEFLGRPYKANTLEAGETEGCVVNIDFMDCVTFYENCLATARVVKGGRRPTFWNVRPEVTRMRYRDGRIEGYESRLHYTADWFFDNARRSIVSLPAIPGSERMSKKIDFMSTHPQSYKQLKSNPALVGKIAGHERKISGRAMRFVPKAALASSERYLQTGDIVGITTSVEGLDCSHTGICYRDGAALRLLHASSKAGKVILDGPLVEYVAASSKATGIIVARPIF